MKAVFLLFAMNAVAMCQELDSSDKYLPLKDVEEIRRRAVAGDGEASYKLSNFYEFSENEIDESMFWGRLSAEQGFCSGVKDQIDMISRGHVKSINLDKYIKYFRDKCSR